MRAALASLLCASILFAGCGSSQKQEEEPTDRLTVGKVQGEIKTGMSGAGVLEVLGSPNIISTDDERREVWVYDRISTTRTEARTSSYGTLILVGSSSSESDRTTRQRTLTIIIKFDHEKKVRDFAYNYTQF